MEGNRKGKWREGRKREGRGTGGRIQERTGREPSPA